MSARVSATEAADIVGCSESFIRKLIKRGELGSAEKVNGRWSILRDDLDNITVGAPVRTVRIDGPHVRSAQSNEADVRSAHADEPSVQTKRTDEPPEWRDDLLAQVARLEADVVQRDTDKEKMRDDFDARLGEQRQESGLIVEAAKARVVHLERELTVRDSRIADLSEQVSVLEAKVRETLEAHAEKLGDLASDIAELANAKGQMELRVYELQPVAEQVPMLQAAVEEKDASLSARERELGNIRQDIDAIASRRVTGPVFRLLTKGKLRR